VADAESVGQDASYDLVCFFDCFHDMAVAGKAAKNACRILKQGGMVMLIEMMGPYDDSVSAHLALPSTAMLTCFSCHFCTPSGMCDSGDALGTVVPTSKHEKLFVDAAGFKSLDSLESGLNEIGFRLLLAKK